MLLKNSNKPVQILVVLFCLLSVVLLPSGGLLHAAEKSVRPGVNDSYRDPDLNLWTQRFERPGREVYDKRHQILAATKIQKGMRIADVGAGTGLFTRLFARKVGAKGRVYAIDITPAFIHNIKRQAKEQKLGNIRGVISTSKSITLPSASVDMVFVCATYHHFEYPLTILGSMYKALKPDGSLVVIDFRKQKGLSSAWVMQHVRASKTQVIKEITSSGFRLTEDRPILQVNYFLRFKKL